MHGLKTVMTTGEVAKICNVAPRTVSKWFDAGYLNGYRIPGSKDRRIPLDQLVRFMRAHGIPLNGLETGTTRVLVLDADAGFGEGIHTALTERERYEVLTATSALEAGAIAQERKPHVFLVDVSLPDVTPTTVARFARTLPGHAGMCLIGMATGLTEAQGQALLQEGFHGYLSKPFEAFSLVTLIDSGVSVAGGA